MGLPQKICTDQMDQSSGKDISDQEVKKQIDTSDEKYCKDHLHSMSSLKNARPKITNSTQDFCLFIENIYPHIRDLPEQSDAEDQRIKKRRDKIELFYQVCCCRKPPRGGEVTSHDLKYRF